MKIFLDFLPIIIFFAVYKWQGIYVATASAIVVTLFQVVFSYIKNKKVSPILWVNLVIISLLGGATLLFHNEWFIKWKPTVLYLFFGLALLVSKQFFNVNLFKKLAGQDLELTPKTWDVLSNSWMYFFFFVALLNIVVAYYVSTEIWVNFKLFGLLGVTFLFIIIQAVFIAKVQAKEEEKSVNN